MKVLHVLTVADSLIFLTGRAKWMAQRGVVSEVACSPDPRLVEFGRDEGVAIHPVRMHRAISPLADILAIARLTRAIKASRPDIVHSHTPKGGLLGMVAARLARVPVQIYHIHGLPFETATGVKRRLLVAADWVSCQLATEVFAVSTSVLEVAHRNKICADNKGLVFGAGSINGVDMLKFDRHKAISAGKALRDEIGLPEDAQVVGFVGRLSQDKGIGTLLTAWTHVRKRYPKATLLVVGDWEANDPVPEDIVRDLESDNRVHMTGFVANPLGVYSLIDILAFPSRREGFGLVALEAAALEIPVVATDTTGLRDAVVHGTTGILVPPNSPQAFGEAICSYLASPALRKVHGRAGQQRARVEFQPSRLWQSTLATYQRLLKRTGL